MQLLIIIIGAIGFIAGSIALTSAWSGFVLVKLWAWFIVPQFHAAPLSITTAIGIALITGLLCKAPGRGKDEEWKAGVSIAVMLIVPTIALLFGWIVTLFA